MTAEIPSVIEALPTRLIYRSARARPLDSAHVKSLAKSISDAGLINPIMVKKVRRPHGGVVADVYEIIAGGHRYEAVVSLGREEISAIVVGSEVSELVEELREIDENIIRVNLTEAQESLALKRRKVIYEILHPETVHGHAGAKARWDAVANVATASAERFTAETAKATGRSERSIQRKVQRGEKLKDALPDLVGTSLDNGKELDALMSMGPEDREDLIQRAKAGEKVSARRSTRRESDSSETKASRVDADVKDRAANECAQVIAEYVPGEAWDSLKANLYAAGAKNVANALTNITGQSIMDQRYA